MSHKATGIKAVESSGDATSSCSASANIPLFITVSSSILKPSCFKAIDSIFLWEPA